MTLWMWRIFTKINYAHEAGFSVRIGQHKEDDEEIVTKYFYYSREGYRVNNDKKSYRSIRERGGRGGGGEEDINLTRFTLLVPKQVSSINFTLFVATKCMHCIALL
jgi:hypothetical protein